MFENLSFFKKEKKNSDVFDVINKRVNRYGKDLLLTLPKLGSIVIRLSKIKREGGNTEVIERDLIDVVKKIVPVLVDSAHYSYEVYKEVEYKYGYERLLEYVKRSGKDPVEFAYNYTDNKEMMMKLLALFAVLNSEGISANDLNDPSIPNRIINGESEMDIISEKLECLSDKAQEELEEIIDKDIKYEQLSSEIHSLTDKYHFEYMTNYVYPYVLEDNFDSKSEEKVMKLASKLGNKRKRY